VGSRREEGTVLPLPHFLGEGETTSSFLLGQPPPTLRSIYFHGFPVGRGTPPSRCLYWKEEFQVLQRDGGVGKRDPQTAAPWTGGKGRGAAVHCYQGPPSDSFRDANSENVLARKRRAQVAPPQLNNLQVSLATRAPGGVMFIFLVEG
jgi:hypothetical protein